MGTSNDYNSTLGTENGFTSTLGSTFGSETGVSTVGIVLTGTETYYILVFCNFSYFYGKFYLWISLIRYFIGDWFITGVCLLETFSIATALVFFGETGIAILPMIGTSTFSIWIFVLLTSSFYGDSVLTLTLTEFFILFCIFLTSGGDLFNSFFKYSSLCFNRFSRYCFQMPSIRSLSFRLT